MPTKSASQPETLKDRVMAFLARTPTLAEAKRQIEQTRQRIEATKQNLAETLEAEEQAALAFAEGMDEAAEVRDTARRDARILRDELHELETVLRQQEDRLGDAQSAHKADADRATWAEFEKLAERREKAGQAADAAVIALGDALRALERETALIATLMGEARPHLGVIDVRGHLRAALMEAVNDHRDTGLVIKPVAEVVAGQHAVVRLQVKL